MTGPIALFWKACRGDIARSMRILREFGWSLLAVVATALVLLLIVFLPSEEQAGGINLPKEPAVETVPLPPVTQTLNPRPVPAPSEAASAVPAGMSPLEIQKPEKPVATADNRPMIAIVIDDMAHSRKRFQIANRLPAAISFALLPYVDNVSEMAGAARAAGHELLVHLPMEPFGPIADPGPGALKVGDSLAEWESRLQRNLGAFDGYIGINNHMGSRATANPEMMKWLMTALKKRGLSFLDSKTSAKSVAEKAARGAGVPTAGRHVFLDPDGSGDVAAQQFASALRLAKKNGAAILICHPYAKTLTFLATEISEDDPRYRLVPISRLLK